ncbi:MFS transporter [Luteibacter sp. OK325]|uniref:MFS transporter n=1 Tax=Luteibacter sp. OK325 TaxID=2135670 RepID=UPI0018EE5317|nr:MFS transporter [Luteibacter sp. OK325]
MKIPIFRALWIATIVSNIGTWMQDVGAGWLMTSLSTSPLMVALVQASTTLPMFVLSMPAGALADIVDRRRLLIITQLWMLGGAALLAVTTFAGLTGPGLLLSMVCAIATGMALSAPAFQATVPELVDAAALPQAVMLVSLGVNIARAIGPALGGLVIAITGGPAAVFALNAVSGIGVVVVLLHWRREAPRSDLPAEHFLGALRAGVRYTLQAPAMLAVLLRCVAFFVFASALWALLPVIGRRELHLDPMGYGALLGFLGLGAVIGAAILPELSRRTSSNSLATIACLLFALATGLLGMIHHFAATAVVVFMAGFAWISIMSSFSGAAQMASPAWVKARSLAIFILVSQGAMTLGSTFWGWLASQAGISVTLITAGTSLAAVQLLLLRFPFDMEATLDLAPAPNWPTPLVRSKVSNDRGPVLVTIEYRVDSSNVAAFVQAMIPVRRSRLRGGAMFWAIYEDVAVPGTFLETFVVQSWIEHRRQHERGTPVDRGFEETAQHYHLGPPPVVRHLIAPL